MSYYDNHGGGGRQPKVLLPTVGIKSATKKGYETATENDSINLTFPDSKTRRGRVGVEVGVSQTLDTQCNQGILEVIPTQLGNSANRGNSAFCLRASEPNGVIEIIGSLNGVNEANSRIYGLNGISPSLMAGNNGGGQNPTKHLTSDFRIRRLTPRECLRLQDFSEDFKQVVSNSQMYKQVGNSMSANVVEMIFRQIEKSRESSIISEGQGSLF